VSMQSAPSIDYLFEPASAAGPAPGGAGKEPKRTIRGHCSVDAILGNDVWGRQDVQVAFTRMPVRMTAPSELAPRAQTASHPPVAPAVPARKLSTAEEVALSADVDFSAFVTRGMDKAVQRLAMRELFADPYFNQMDGLDVYIDDD